MKKILIILLCFPMIGFSQLKVAILDFENTSGIDKYDGLGKAMSNMLITDLNNNIHPRKIVFMERSQLNKILDEQNMQKSKNFDKSTAVNFGKLAGVNFVIVGSIFVLDKDCNITSRMVNVETSEIIHSKEVDGPINNWMTLKSNLAQEFAKSVNNPIPVENTDQTMAEGVLVQYSKAIDAIDENNVGKAEDIILMMKDLGVDFDYLDLLSQDIQVIKDQIKELEKDVEVLQLNTKAIQEDLSELRKVVNEDISMNIKNPKTMIDFLSNIHYHNKIKDSDFITKINAYDEMFLNYQINFFDIYLEYYNILCAYDYSETYDNDYAAAINKVNTTIENSCSDPQLKDFLVLFFSNCNQPLVSVHALFNEFAIYEGAYKDTAHVSTRNQKIIDKYDKLLMYFNKHLEHNFIKSLWLQATPYANRRLGFSNSFFHHDGNDEKYLAPIEQFRWFIKQVDLLENINMDFDYKNIDSYFLHKQNATSYISILQSYIPFHESFYLEYSKIKNTEEWSSLPRSSFLFAGNKISEIFSWETNYSVSYYSNGNKKKEGGLVSGVRNWEKLEACNESGYCLEGKVISYYKNGDISSIAFYDEGKKVGLHTDYYKNSRIKSEKVFNRNVQIDSCIVYYTSGNIFYEGKYADRRYYAERQGIWKYYFPDGTLKTEIDFGGGDNGYFFRDKRFGIYKSYYENGQIEFEGRYKGDIMVGKWRYWYDNGNINYDIEYAVGVMADEHYYNKYGPDSSGTSQALRVGEYRCYYNNGDLKTKGQYLDGLKLGVWESEGYGIKKEGAASGEYATSQKIGLWQYWYENRSLKSEYEYEEGKLITKRTWDENGTQTLNWEKE